MSSIDERIVKMELQSEQFNKNAQATVKSLNDLKEGLDMSGASKSLNEIEKVANDFSLSGISAGLDAISKKFTVMGIAGITAVQRFTNYAISSGKRIVSAFTITPVKTGFQEYETQINAIQTILANTSSKGTTLEDVNKALDELNRYADMTIYNFTQMTANIGRFTAAGINLDTSVAAIKGISNLAAVSGSTSQQASMAMYQLSQALSSGTVKLMDWNSVVNAGMGGQVFQDAIKETARVHGIQIDKMIEEEGSFRETLSKGWFTSSILTETLQKFTGDLTEEQLAEIGYTEEQIKAIVAMGKTANDAATKVKTFTQLFDTLKEAAQSGWTQTWETIVGDFEEARSLLTEISDTFSSALNKSAEVRNNLLKGWKDLGGRNSLIQSARNAYLALADAIGIVKKAFRDIFPKATPEQLMAITRRLEEITLKFKMGEKTSERFYRALKGLFALIGLGIDVVSALASGIGNLLSYLGLAKDDIFELAADLGDLLVAFRENVKINQDFRNSVQRIVEIVKKAIGYVANFVKNVVDGLSQFAAADVSDVQDFTDRLIACFHPLVALGNFVGRILSAILSLFENFVPFLYKLGKTIGIIFGALFEFIADVFEGFSFENLLALINTGALVTLAQKLGNFADGILGIGSELKDIGSNINESLSAITEILKAMAHTINANALVKIALSLILMAIALSVVSNVDKDKLIGALTALEVMLVELFTALGAFIIIVDKNTKSFKKVAKLSNSLIPLAFAVFILAKAVEVLSKIPAPALFRSLFGLAIIMVALVKGAKALHKLEGDILQGAGSLIVLASSIFIISSALKILGTLSPERLIVSLAGLIGILIGIVLFAENLKGVQIDPSVIKSLVKLGLSVVLISSALKIMSTINFQDMLVALIGLAGLLTGIVIFSKYMKKAEIKKSVAISLMVISISIVALSTALLILSTISFGRMITSLLGLAAAMAILVITVKAMPLTIPIVAAGLIMVATALLGITAALFMMSRFSLESIVKSLGFLAATLGIISLALTSMGLGIFGATALLVTAAALDLLIPILTTLALMPIGTMIKVFIGLATAFAILGAAAIFLFPLAPAMLIVGAALLVFGAAIATIGIGVATFASGMATMALSGAAGIYALKATIVGILDLLPSIINKLAEWLPSIINLVKEFLVSLIGIIGDLLTNLLNVIEKAGPHLIKVVLDLITELIKQINEHLPTLIDNLIGIIVGIVDGITRNLGRIIDALINLVIEILNKLGEAIVEQSPRLAEAIYDLAKNIVVGLFKGILTAFKQGGKWLKELWEELKKAFWESFEINSPSKFMDRSGVYIMQGLDNGLKSGEKDVLKTFSGLVNDVEDSSDVDTTSFKNVGTNISRNIKKGFDSSGLTNGFNDMVNDMDDEVTITPVLDMSVASSQYEDFANTLSNDSPTTGVGSVRAAVGNSIPTADQSSQNGSDSSTSTNYNFTQNNYSPKSLSRVEIYRQTNNQFKSFERRMSNA